MGYFDWIIGPFLFLSGIVMAVLVIGLAITSPLGAVLAVLFAVGVWRYWHWAVRYNKKHRRNT